MFYCIIVFPTKCYLLHWSATRNYIEKERRGNTTCTLKPFVDKVIIYSYIRNYWLLSMYHPTSSLHNISRMVISNRRSPIFTEFWKYKPHERFVNSRNAHIDVVVAYLTLYSKFQNSALVFIFFYTNKGIYSQFVLRFSLIIIYL